MYYPSLLVLWSLCWTDDQPRRWKEIIKRKGKNVFLLYINVITSAKRISTFMIFHDLSIVLFNSVFYFSRKEREMTFGIPLLFLLPCSKFILSCGEIFNINTKFWYCLAEIPSWVVAAQRQLAITTKYLKQWNILLLNFF